MRPGTKPFAEKRIREALSRGDALTVKQLAARTGLSRGAIYAAISRLRKALEIVHATTEEQGKAWRLYE